MIHISEELFNALLSAPNRSYIFGTFNFRADIGCIVSYSKDKPEIYTLPVLAKLDDPDPGLPLVIFRRNNFLRISNLRGEPLPISQYSSKDFYKRTPFDPEVVSYLKKQRIFVLGLGSVGSEFSLALAQAGIGNIAGADPDSLEVHNCMRHVLGTNLIGWNKSLAMKEYLKIAAPEVEFSPIPEDLFSGERKKLKEFLDSFKPDAIAALTDAKGVQHLCQIATIYSQALFFSMGCYSNAIEGEAFFRLPDSPIPEDDLIGYACYEDLHPSGEEEHPVTEYDYSDDVPGRYAGEPALGHLIKQKVYTAVTLFVHALMYNASGQTESSQVTLNHLRRGAQYVRFGGPYVSNKEGFVKANIPWEVKWCRIKRNKDCEICGDDVNVEKNLFPEYDIGEDVKAEGECGI